MLQVSGIERPMMRNHIPCMPHCSRVSFGAFITTIDVEGCTISWESHLRNQQFGQTETTDNAKSQRLQQERNARINNMSAMKPGLPKIIQREYISRYFDSTETDHDTAVNAGCIGYTGTMLLKQDH